MDSSMTSREKILVMHKSYSQTTGIWQNTHAGWGRCFVTWRSNNSTDEVQHSVISTNLTAYMSVDNTCGVTTFRSLEIKIMTWSNLILGN